MGNFSSRRSSDVSQPLLFPGWRVVNAHQLGHNQDERKQNNQRQLVGWSQAQPEDPFVHIFSYLTPGGLARAALVNKAWQHVAYSPSLWRTLDFSSISHKVDDDLLEQMLHESRFSELTVLNLAGCTALTNRAIDIVFTTTSNTLEELTLTECNGLDAYQLCLQLEPLVPSLTKLELFQCVPFADVVPVVESLLSLNPCLDMGLLWLVYCARTGTKVNAAKRRRWELQMAARQAKLSAEEALGSPKPLRYINPKEMREGAASPSALRSPLRSPRFIHQLPERLAPDDDDADNDADHDEDEGAGEVIGRRPFPPFNIDNNNAVAIAIPHAAVAPAPPAAAADGLPPDDVVAPLDEDGEEAVVISRIYRERRDHARCRHQGALANNLGCWGAVKGTIVFSNREEDYGPPGNWPHEVLFSCAQHRTQEAADVDLYQCHMCELTFRMGSMWSPQACRVCYDQEILCNKNVWTSLETKTEIDNLTFAHVATQTLKLADRRNLPKTLRSRGIVQCDLDYSLDADLLGIDVEEQPIDRTHVPLPAFLASNKERLAGPVAAIQQKMLQARARRDERALMCFDDRNHIEVLSDKAVIIHGRETADQMELTLQAWRHLKSLVYYLIMIMFVVAYFVPTIYQYVLVAPVGQKTDYTYLLNIDNSDINFSQLLILGGVAVVVFVVIIILMLKFRELCMKIWKAIFALDILLLQAFGLSFGFMLVLNRYGIPVDAITFAIIGWNYGVAALWSTYMPVPPDLLRFFISSLNAITATIAVLLLGQYIIIPAALAVVVDVVAMIRPEIVRWSPPFLIPHALVFEPEPPRLLFEIGNLKLRASDLIWFAAMLGFVDPFNVVAVSCAFITAVASLCLCVFVLPFITGKIIRSLPVAFVGVLIITVTATQLLTPYVTAVNTPLKTSVYRVLS